MILIQIIIFILKMIGAYRGSIFKLDFCNEFYKEAKKLENVSFGILGIREISNLINNEILEKFFKRIKDNMKEKGILLQKDYDWVKFDSEENSILKKNWRDVELIFEKIRGIAKKTDISFEYIDGKILKEILNIPDIFHILEIKCNLFGTDTFQDFSYLCKNLAFFLLEFHFIQDFSIYTKMKAEVLCKLRPKVKCNLRKENRSSLFFEKWENKYKIKNFVLKMIKKFLKSKNFLWLEKPEIAVFPIFIKFFNLLLSLGFFNIDDSVRLINYISDFKARLKKLENQVFEEITDPEMQKGFNNLFQEMRHQFKLIIIHLIHLIHDEVLTYLKLQDKPGVGIFGIKEVNNYLGVYKNLIRKAKVMVADVLFDFIMNDKTTSDPKKDDPLIESLLMFTLDYQPDNFYKPNFEINEKATKNSNSFTFQFNKPNTAIYKKPNNNSKEENDDSIKKQKYYDEKTNTKIFRKIFDIINGGMIIEKPKKINGKI